MIAERFSRFGGLVGLIFCVCEGKAMIQAFAIFIGGGIGAVLRYLVGIVIFRVLCFPLSTFIANVLGSFIIGFLSAYFMNRMELSDVCRLALTVGFCGGLTTFSTFSLELFEMLVQQRFLPALAYAALSISLCLAAVYGGMNLGKLFFSIAN